jgi:hypothetical protein
MGRNEVYEREYPLARTEYKPLYLTSGGGANSNRGDGRPPGRSRLALGGRSLPVTTPTTRFRRSAATTAAALYAR